jgi:hypothetical protein
MNSKQCLFLFLSSNRPACVSALCVSVFLFCTEMGISGGDISITGTVVDARTGLPCSGVTVLITGTSIKTATDSSGGFTLSDVPDGELFLSFNGDLFLPVILRVYVEENAKTITLDSIRLQGDYGIVTGCYGDSDSIPLPGVCITYSSTIDSSIIDSAVTDSSGQYVFSRVTPDSLGLIFTAAKDGYLPSVCTLSVKRGDSIHSFVCMSVSSTVAGTVVENDSTTPIEGVTALFGRLSSLTDGTGSFRISGIAAPISTSSFTFIKYGYDTLFFMDTVTASAVIGPIVLHKATGIVSGTVFVQGKKDRSGVVVCVSSRGLCDTTDATGHYEIGNVPSGEQVLTATVDRCYTPPCTLSVLAHQVNNAVLMPIIQAGVIDTMCDWYHPPLGSSAYTIRDTLIIASGGALRVHPGVHISMEAGARILVQNNGSFSTLGKSDSLVAIGPSTVSGAASTLEFEGLSEARRLLSYTKIVNCRVTLTGDCDVRHCLFVSSEEQDSSPLLHLASSSRFSLFKNCDFIRMASARGPVALRSFFPESEVRFSDCIFYTSTSAGRCGSFIQSEQMDGAATAVFTGCDFYAPCAIQDSLFSGIHYDTSNIVRLDPEYADAANGNFFLRASSPLLSAPVLSAYIGALGPEQETSFIRDESDDCLP